MYENLFLKTLFLNDKKFHKIETNTHFEKKKGVIAFYIKLYFNTSIPQSSIFIQSL